MCSAGVVDTLMLDSIVALLHHLNWILGLTLQVLSVIFLLVVCAYVFHQLWKKRQMEADRKAMDKGRETFQADARAKKKSSSSYVPLTRRENSYSTWARTDNSFGHTAPS